MPLAVLHPAFPLVSYPRQELKSVTQHRSTCYVLRGTTTCNVPCATCHLLFVLGNLPGAICHVQRAMCIVQEAMCNVPCTTCHVSCDICHMPRGTCPTGPDDYVLRSIDTCFHLDRAAGARSLRRLLPLTHLHKQGSDTEKEIER